jgi:hypothetical protein
MVATRRSKATTRREVKLPQKNIDMTVEGSATNPGYKSYTEGVLHMKSVDTN